ncbi:unnamed protein product [Prunus armeniaca]|uniref:Uncharacterized protein n=1 Tax=Prunus armeniaca TaxID=36596 RepID=A0A6J5XJE5_PRUAR|nr:unnamed protein product [Prunus armeniaca]CAB4312095.1 unnamed protein product [Prunus armeniaca]
MEITGHTMVWGQTGVETWRSLTVYVLKVQVEGLNYLGWEQNSWETFEFQNLNFKIQRVPISTCFLARLRSRVGVSAARTCPLLGGLSDQWWRFRPEVVALVRIRAELGVSGEDDGDGASNGIIVTLPQRKLLEQAIVAL